jgi:hypothetical protein
MSQLPGAAGRQVELAARKPSVGQVFAMPLQFSATSHRPATARHGYPASRMPSAGQVAELPVQVSGMSHGPVAALHVVPPLAKRS